MNGHSPFQQLCDPLLKQKEISPSPNSSPQSTTDSSLKSILKNSNTSSRNRAKTLPSLSNSTTDFTSIQNTPFHPNLHCNSEQTPNKESSNSKQAKIEEREPPENDSGSSSSSSSHYFKACTSEDSELDGQTIDLRSAMKWIKSSIHQNNSSRSLQQTYGQEGEDQTSLLSCTACFFSSPSPPSSLSIVRVSDGHPPSADALKMSAHHHHENQHHHHRSTVSNGGASGRNTSPTHQGHVSGAHAFSSGSSESIGSVSLINGGAPGLSSNVNLFKRDSGKAIRHFQNQTTNQFIQRTIAAHLDHIQKNKSNIASDRAFLEGMELGMQLNGFLNKLTRDSKDYVKELLDGVANEVVQRSCYHGCNYCPNSVNPYGDMYGIESSVHNMLQNAQTAAFSTNFVQGCMQQAISKTMSNQK